MESEQIKKDVEAFLAKGGQIEVVPPKPALLAKRDLYKKNVTPVSNEELFNKFDNEG